MSPDLWERWLSLYQTFASEGLDVAAPFTEFVPDDFKLQSRKILYIGKATKGSCDKELFDQAALKSSSAARQQSENFSRAVFESRYDRSGPSFWGFANDLAKALNPNVTGLSNLVWSNICKIGSAHGNAEGRVLDEQVVLAVESLKTRFEICSPISLSASQIPTQTQS